ncbi:MAG: hypothetical protein NVSMB5_06960 [Candidatus Velthaea sp.]
MIVRRLLLGISALTLAAAVAACGSSAGSQVVPAPAGSPSASPAGTTFVVLGDDATVAIGTAACGTALPSATCPTSATQAGTPLTLSGAPVNGYAQIFAQHLNSLHPAQAFFPVILGVSGALTGSVPVASPSPANDIVENVAQLSTLPGAASSAAARGDRLAIGVFAGINDVVDAFYSQQCTGTLTGTGGSIAVPCGAHGTTLPPSTTSPRSGTLYNAYRAVFTAIRNASPSATLVLSIPDLSKFPAFAGSLSLSSAQLAVLSSDVQLANAALKAAADDSTLKYAYADIYGAGLIQPALYGAPGFASDGFHFSETGYSRIEGLAEQAFTATFPSF